MPPLRPRYCRSKFADGQQSSYFLAVNSWFVVTGKLGTGTYLVKTASFSTAHFSDEVAESLSQKTRPEEMGKTSCQIEASAVCP